MLVAFVKHINYSTCAGKWQGISCVEVEIILCGDRCVNCNNICPLGMGIVAFFVSLVVLCYKVQWGRGMMAFCVSLGVLFYYKASGSS